ncbi:hypothetical protein [Methylobacterium sp. J-076]|uniref:hypothetical protein n=1 Tax=Methylobacterium sp. J-076 TaxID=2836655 RepID=UPI001FBBB7CD|nr:hypothetical protein [Methylobacterium sp. J-076]MCJ2011545.1 hypothetical protein [Methylobacterium sp. J-076]
MSILKKDMRAVPLSRVGTSPILSDLALPKNYSAKSTLSSDLASIYYPEDYGSQALHLHNSTFKPIWRKLESASSFPIVDLEGHAAGILNFDIDLYSNDIAPISFNVKCLILVTPNTMDDNPAKILLPSGSTLQIKNSSRWADMRMMTSGDANLNGGIVELLHSLIAQRSSIVPALSAREPIRITEARLRQARAEFETVVDSLSTEHETDHGEALSKLYAYFDKYCFIDTLKEYIESNRYDLELVKLMLSAACDVASSTDNSEIKDYVFELATEHPKAGIRYSAVEALRNHLDEKIKSLLSIRFKDEKNRTVAASLAAAIK